MPLKLAFFNASDTLAKTDHSNLESVLPSALNSLAFKRAIWIEMWSLASSFYSVVTILFISLFLRHIGRFLRFSTKFCNICMP